MNISRDEAHRLVALIVEARYAKRRSDAAYASYDKVKVPCGFAALASFAAFLGVFVFGDPAELERLVGEVGVGSLPLVFAFSMILLLRRKSAYDKSVREMLRIHDKLRPIGFDYVEHEDSVMRLGSEEKDSILTFDELQQIAGRPTSRCS